MRRPIRNLFLIVLCFLFSTGFGPFTLPECDVHMVRALLASKKQSFDLGAFFAFAFNVQGTKDGAFGNFRQWFKSEEADIEAKKKAAAKLAVKTYKGGLQKTQSTNIAVSKKTPKDKRVTITALKDDVNGFVQSEQIARGPFDARVTVAVDKTEGLVSGQSLAGLELQRPAGFEPLAFTSIVAAYTEDEEGDFLGFVVQAFEDPGVSIDVAQLIEGTAEVELRIQQTSTQLITMARPAPAGGPDPGEQEGGGWMVVSTQNVLVPIDDFTLGFGASNLNKKGTFYFDFFQLGQVAPGPDLEQGYFTTLALAILDLGDAHAALTGEVPDTELAEDELNEARDRIGDVQDDLLVEIDAGNLGDQIERKVAAKVLKRTLKGADRLIKTLEKGKAKKPAKLGKAVGRVIDDTSVVMANVAGAKTTNHRQLSFVLPPVIDDNGGGGGAACTNPAPAGGEFATATHGGADWVATTLKAETIDGQFDFQFEDCVGEGSYLLLEFTFPGQPSVGVHSLGFFGGDVRGFAKNIKNPNAFGILFGGTLEITAFDPKTETLEGTFSSSGVFDVDDALDGSFRIEDFE
jgi:hypothetical protein